MLSFFLLEKYNQHTLIEARPHTGYTHQIRAHLAYLGFPVLADTLYGDSDPQALDITSQSPICPIQRLALHACSILFTHPTTLDRLTFSAPYPTDFTHAMLALRSEK